MGRLVEPSDAERSSGRSPLRSIADAGNDYAARVAKYVPAEIVAAYLSLLGILNTVPREDPIRVIVAWGALVLCLVLTPVYFRLLARAGQPCVVQMVVSTAAFVVWAYALGGAFEMVGYHKPWLGSILLVCFTLISGLVRPAQRRTDRLGIAK
jgi:hypothetical protein